MRNILTEKYLPIGSVVKVKDVIEPVMILGYFSIPDKSKSELSDYIGCNIYESAADTTISFHKDSIENVLFMGYKNEIVSSFLNRLTEMRNAFEEGKTTEEVITKYLQIIEKEEGDKKNE